MSNLQYRIKKARTEHGLSVEEVSKKLAENGIKVSARTIYSYELNERQPSVLYLQALVDLLEVNPDWLLSGRGDVFPSETSSAALPANVDLSQMVFLPLINMAASAGYGSLIQERELTKDFIAFAQKWLTDITVASPKHLMVFTVKGNSMAGEINDGDLIIVNETMNDLSNDGTYVVSIDDKLYVKLLQRKAPGNICPWYVSKNQEYSPFTVDLETEHFKIIGKVIWSGGKKDRY